MALDIVKPSKTNQAWSTKNSIIIAIVSLIIGLAIFALAYVSMSRHTYLDAFNQPILSWMISHRQAQFTPIVAFITSFAGSLYLSVAVSVIALIWAISRRELWRPALLIGAVGFCSIIATVLKPLAHNARPIAENMIKPLELDYSFPSGHTLAIIVFTLVFGYLIISRCSSKLRIAAWLLATIILTFIIACSRLYQGYHWLTDVTASIGIGFVVLALVIFADRFFISIYSN